MSLNYHTARKELAAAPRVWLVTGVAGFIGSNLLETLLGLGQRVTGLDNFDTGSPANLEQVRHIVGEENWRRFRFIEGDIRDLGSCRRASDKVEIVLHQAALGSVPRSIERPLDTHASNVTGFLNMLIASREAGVKRFVYASSSAVYGDEAGLPKVEERIGKPLSPYAASKLMNEVYAAAFAQAYGVRAIGLRYFNVFGPRQDPEGAYAAVIPKWIAALLKGEPVRINGDGETSRDFCYIENVVQANVLAGVTRNTEALDQAYNIAFGQRTTLNELFANLEMLLSKADPKFKRQPPVYGDFRPGDVRHSLADISKARRLLAYEPTHSYAQGLELAMGWYRANLR